MVLTASTMLPLGTTAPDFALPDVVSGNTLTLAQVKGAKGMLVMFICAHCPYVVHVESVLGSLAAQAKQQGLGVVAISSNDIENYPEDSPEHLKAQAERLGWTFPYFYDESQAVAKAYTAACTPDFFLFDEAGALVYRGQLDGSRPGNTVPLTGEDLLAAIDALASGQAISADQKPSMGCNIKWKPGA